VKTNVKKDNQELDIPKDDIECWEKYPKHRWVYESSRLLDSQNILWSPYETEFFSYKTPNMILHTEKPVEINFGNIYTKRPTGNYIIADVHIIKGEIKSMRHFDPMTNKELQSPVGEVELRLNAFITLYFKKFTGVITTETCGNEILRISLKPYIDINNETNTEVIKLMKRIYKKTDLTLNGLTDQVFHESLAS